MMDNVPLQRVKKDSPSGRKVLTKPGSSELDEHFLIYNKMNLEEKTKRRNESRKNHKRFYTSMDMAIIKKDAATRMAQVKRGEVPKYPNNIVVVCGCGVEGCFLHVGFENRNETKKVEKTNNKIKPKTKKTDYKVDWKSKEFLDNSLKEMNEK